MKERTAPCIYYTFAGGPCVKGHKDVHHNKQCQHCVKYRPRPQEKIKDNRTRKGKKKKDMNKDFHNQLKDL